MFDCVYEEYIVLHIPHSKGDQLRKGDEVVIARCGSATSPVGKLEEYMRRRRMSWEDSRFLFRPICKTKLGDRLREPGSISYSFLHGLFKKLMSLGYDPKDFGLHLVEQLRQQMQEFPTGCLSAMVDGNPKMPMMDK